jgi:hypothetical protein
MRKALLAVVGATSVIAATISVPSKAEATCYGCWAGGAFAAGLIGGAILANRAYGYGYYGPSYGYGYRGYYAQPYYDYAPYYGYGYGYGYGYAPAYYGYAPRYYYPSRYYPGSGVRPYRAYYTRYGYRRANW